MSIHKKDTPRKEFSALFSLSLMALLVSLCVSSFALGRLTVGEKEEKSLRINTVSASVLPLGPTETDETGERAALTAGKTSSAFLVGSRNSDKYHLLTCPGAKRINEENKIFFSSYEEARAAGYVPAGNCEGLQ